jgi:hypothetical protein
MNRFKYEVTLHVEVEAFDESDAWDIILDNFGVGNANGVVVETCEWEEIARTS